MIYIYIHITFHGYCYEQTSSINSNQPWPPRWWSRLPPSPLSDLAVFERLTGENCGRKWLWNWGIWWYMMVYDGIWWYMMVYDGIFTIIYQWYMMVYVSPNLGIFMGNMMRNPQLSWYLLAHFWPGMGWLPVVVDIQFCRSITSTVSWAAQNPMNSRL